MSKFTYMDLIQHAQSGYYKQMPIDELRRLLDEGSMDINEANPVRVEKTRNATGVVRDHLRYIEYLQNDAAAENRHKADQAKFVALEGKLEVLKKPHWTVWLTVTLVIVGLAIATLAWLFPRSPTAPTVSPDLRAQTLVAAPVETLPRPKTMFPAPQPESTVVAVPVQPTPKAQASQTPTVQPKP